MAPRAGRKAFWIPLPRVLRTLAGDDVRLRERHFTSMGPLDSPCTDSGMIPSRFATSE